MDNVKRRNALLIGVSLILAFPWQVVFIFAANIQRQQQTIQKIPNDQSILEGRKRDVDRAQIERWFQTRA